MMKRIFSMLLAVCLLMGMFSASVFAADNSRAYNFDLTGNGKQEVTAAPGELVNMTLVLDRTDSKDASDMYAVQAEFWYDDTFLELVESSVLTYDNVEWTDSARRTGGRAFYLNFLSLGGGLSWESSVQMGTFQFKVIGKSGSTVIESKNCLVSTKDGSDTYVSADNNVTIAVSTECLVTFDSMGGSEVSPQSVRYGEKVIKPKDPTREGYNFTGWYTDLDRTNEWDFDKDTVKENMTLYAGWGKGSVGVDTGDMSDIFPWMIAAVAAFLFLFAFLSGKKTVRFDSRGGSPVASIKVKKGEYVSCPLDPAKPGAVFGGWYTSANGSAPWDFQNGKVEKNMTLYARWSE